jgi:hypothetical protein
MNTPTVRLEEDLMKVDPTTWTQEELNNLQRTFTAAAYIHPHTSNWGSLANVVTVEKSRRLNEKLSKDTHRTARQTLFVSLLALIISLITAIRSFWI